jgi:hypothetical protein
LRIDPDGPSQSEVRTVVITSGWLGNRQDHGAKMQVRLRIESSDSAALQLGDGPAEKITEMHLEGVGVTGASTGVIESPIQGAPEQRC